MSDDYYLTNPPPDQIRYGMDNAPNRMGQMIAMGVVTTVIAATTVGLRLFTRIRIVPGTISFDDYMVAAALLFSILNLADNTNQIRFGLSYHKWEIPISLYNIRYPVSSLIGTCTYAVSIMFSKLSILFFYLRLSPQIWFRRCTYGLIGASITYSLVYVLINIFSCLPVSAGWDRNVQNAVCLDVWSAYYALSILNIVLDVFTLLLPIPVVLPLQMEKRQKISLLLLFTTGAFVCAITIRRTVLIPSLKASKDRTWDVVMDYLLSYLEMNGGIVCASVPALKPLFMRWMPGKMKSYPRSGGSPFMTRDTAGTNTVIEQNKARRMMKPESYRLNSMSDSFTGGNAYREEDDESKLWPSPSDRGSRLYKDPSVSTRSIPVGNKAYEEFPRDGGGHAGKEVLTTSQSTKESGIVVTRETTIHYEK